MRLARADGSYQPAHAHPAVTKKKRSYGALAVIALYAAALGINEWRIQRHVEAVRERENNARVLDVDLDTPAPAGDGNPD